MTKKEQGEKTYEEFATHIQAETKKARAEYKKKVNDSSTADVACIDKLSKNLQWNPPGGGIFLSNEGKLTEWMNAKKSGTPAVHENCGYMRVVMKVDSLQSQKQMIQNFDTEVTKLNNSLGTNFDVVVDTNGSATPYMNP